MVSMATASAGLPCMFLSKLAWDGMLFFELMSFATEGIGPNPLCSGVGGASLFDGGAG